VVVKAIAIPFLKAQTKAGTAVLLMEQEIRIIRGQFRRIRETQKKLNLEPDPERGIQGIGVQMSQDECLDSLAMLFGDIHFLLVATWRMWRLFEQVKMEFPKEPELSAISKKHRGFFERIRKFRNQVEHIEGMVASGIPGLGDVRPSSFGFNDQSFYYGPEVESLVVGFYEEVKSAHEAIAKRKGLKPFEKVTGQMRV